MGKTTTKITNERVKPLRPFLHRVVKKFHPEKIILFGSRARGTFLLSSDYDILLVSPQFSNYGMYERMVEVYKLQDIPVAIDVLCLTPEEFRSKKKRLGIVQQAAEEGLEITGVF